MGKMKEKAINDRNEDRDNFAKMKENKLIAEFMGFPTQTDVVDDRTLAYYVGKSIIHTDNKDNENDDDVYHPEDMQFNTSWDWLMPVIEKVFILSEDEEAWRMDIESGLTTLNIDETYRAVVEFINQLKQD